MSSAKVLPIHSASFSRALPPHGNARYLLGEAHDLKNRTEITRLLIEQQGETTQLLNENKVDVLDRLLEEVKRDTRDPNLPGVAVVDAYVTWKKGLLGFALDKTLDLIDPVASALFDIVILVLVFVAIAGVIMCILPSLIK